MVTLVYDIKDKCMVYIGKNQFTYRVVSDYSYRSVMSAYLSLTFNLFFAVVNGFFAFITHSVWLATMFAYYLVLGMMRFMAVRQDWKNSKTDSQIIIQRRELQVYQNCGVLFLILTIALSASVMQMVYENRGHHYPRTLILGVATYTFYKTILAVWNVIKARQLNSSIIMTLRFIGYAEAVVSMLSLEIGILTTFGVNNQSGVKQLENVTGIIVCVMVFAMGIYMIVSSSRDKNEMKYIGKEKDSKFFYM